MTAEPLPQVCLVVRLVAAERALRRAALEAVPAEAVAAIRNARVLRDRARHVGSQLAPKVIGDPDPSWSWRLP